MSEEDNSNPTPVPTEAELLEQLVAARAEGATDNVLARLLSDLHKRFDDVEKTSSARFNLNTDAINLNLERIAAVSQNLDTAVADLGARIEALEAAPASLRLSFEQLRDLVSAAAGSSMPVIGA